MSSIRAHITYLALAFLVCLADATQFTGDADSPWDVIVPESLQDGIVPEIEVPDVLLKPLS